MSVLPARPQIVVELTFNGNRVGCGTLRGDSREQIEAFHGSGKAYYYPRNISIFQGSGPPQPQRVDGREPRALSGRRGTTLPPFAGRNVAHGVGTGFTLCHVRAHRAELFATHPRY